MSVIDIMEIGRQGLAANQQALQTTSHNIANTNTPGYTRQRAVLQTNPQSVSAGSNNRIGGGVQLKQVVRVHDGFVQNQIREEAKNLGAYRTRSEMLSRLESIVDRESFRPGEIVNRFFNDVRELSANAEAPAVKNAFLNSAKNAASEFRTLSDSLRNLSTEIDGRIEANLNEVNSLTKELASLNETIRTNEAVGNPPLEHLDRRDLVLRELSEKMGLQTLFDDQNNANVQAGGLGVVVHGSNNQEFSVHRTHETENKIAGATDVMVNEGKNPRAVTKGIQSGEIGGLIYIRDQILRPAMDQLDNIAYSFAQSVNDVHREGVGADGLGGRDLFAPMENINGAASAINLSGDINGIDKIAVGYTGAGPGDNRIALKIADLQNMGMVSPAADIPSEGLGSGQTLNDALNNWVGNIAAHTQRENQLMSHQESIVTQLENYHQSIAGVNLEEEAIKMMQYQAVFSASAKAMKVGDELLQTVLSLRP